MSAEDKKHVSIYMEANPNPNSLKFVANFMLVEEGTSYDFPSKSSAQDAPLALQLFDFDFVERVFYMNNFVTVTKKEATDWYEVREEVKSAITEYLEAGKAVLIKGKGGLEINEDDPEVVKKIKGIMDEYIRPAVEQDGGAITFHSFEEGIVKVNLEGSCSGCPSSTITLKSGIENLLKRMLPNDINSVEVA